MLVVDIISLKKISPIKTEIICRFGWDEEAESIVVLKGTKVAENILKDRYLDKRYYPEKIEYIEASQGKAFIENLCYGLTGSYVWATRPYEETE
jgi:hypothetical protein